LNFSRYEVNFLFALAKDWAIKLSLLVYLFIFLFNWDNYFFLFFCLWS
jgi:hypothetical protein